ncbi:hypothetical protein L9W92_08610 [Pelotomaculum terephthalicicum JT]|nr:hypothetical protein [Pelotomaculum terephthalicicum]MCG9968109.1 hypothetical protein [Pelotomaculum terephthalicicum JT]OPX87866.1 MAG: hypothetical protein A4E54_01449 [Pelotomaculum sp. PtaB.Bin117]OPY64037.1 MAG: hypothetical protein A4E56_00089 [Pelotomaculum sp. PtaU1.Bin065]
MFRKEMSSTTSDIKMMTITSLLMTIPFIFYMKDIANSLRTIAERDK